MPASARRPCPVNRQGRRIIGKRNEIASFALLATYSTIKSLPTMVRPTGRPDQGADRDEQERRR
ncbi:hypothetical protein GCM10009605_28250 [Nocardiopsis composta]